LPKTAKAACLKISMRYKADLLTKTENCQKLPVSNSKNCRAWIEDGMPRATVFFRQRSLQSAPTYCNAHRRGLKVRDALVSVYERKNFAHSKKGKDPDTTQHFGISSHKRCQTLIGVMFWIACDETRKESPFRIVRTPDSFRLSPKLSNAAQ